MAKTVYTSAGGGRFCNLTIASLEQGPEAIAIHELSSGGARLEILKGALTVNEYVDVSLDLGAGNEQNLFGHVLKVEGDEAVLRWLFLTSEEEEGQLAQALQAGLEGNPRVAAREGADSPEERFAVEEEARKLAASAKKQQPTGRKRQKTDAYEASDAVATPEGAKAQTTKREVKGAQDAGTQDQAQGARKPRRGAVLPSSARNRAILPDEEDDEPAGRARPLTNRVVRPLPDADADGAEAARVAREIARRRTETDPGGDAGRRSSRRLSATAPTSGVRKVVKPSRGSTPQSAPADEAPRSKRVVKPTKGSRPQVVPTEEPSPSGVQKVVKPSRDAKPAELPVPEADPKPGNTRRIVKPRRMKVSEMPTLARPHDESADDTPRPAIELVDRAVAEADARRAATEPRRPHRPRDAVSRRILSRTRKVDLSSLAAKQKTVRVVNLETIKGLIQDAVDEVVGSMSPVEVLDEEAMAKAVEEKVAERLQSSESEKRDLEAKARGLEVQLKAAQRALDSEREREIVATNFTVSETGLEDLEKHFNRLVQHAIRQNGVGDVLAKELERMVSTLLDKEREKIAEKALKAHEGKMGMLQKQIDRLARSLEDTENERDLNLKRLKIMEAQGGGLANIMEAGLDLEDPDAEKKKELLKEIFEQNRQLREDYKAARGGALPDQSKRLAARAEVERKAQEAIDELKAEQEAAATAAQEESPAQADGDAGAGEDDPYADMTDPDDEVWTGPESGEADGSATGGDPAEAQEDPYANMGDPDDEIWEGPSTTFEQEQAAKGQGDIKLMTTYKDFEPPPLERKQD